MSVPISSCQLTEIPNQQMLNLEELKEEFKGSVLIDDVDYCKEILEKLNENEKKLFLNEKMDSVLTQWAGKEKCQVTPLQCAACIGDENLLELLLNHGAPVNDCMVVSHSTKAAAIHFACERGREKAALLLIRAGARDEMVYCDSLLGTGTYAIPPEAGVGGEWVCLYAIHIAILNKMYDVVSALCENDKSLLNSKTSGGYYPLHLAAREGNEKMVSLLLSLGASKESQTWEKKRPLDIAKAYEHSEIAAML